MDTGLSYFALLTAFGGASSSFFNPAVPLGSYLAGLAGFGSAALPTSAVVGPLVGAVAIGLLESQLPSTAKEGVGVFVLYLVVGAAGAADTFGCLAIGATVAALTLIYNVELNPAVTLAKKFDKYETVLVQLGGALVGGLAGAYLGGFEGTSYDTFDAKAAVGEVLVAVLLVAIIDKSASPRDLGLSYFALLVGFGDTMGSVANPALVVGNFLGNGLLGSGFDFGNDSLVALFVHVAAPIAGGLVSRELFKLLNKTIGDLLVKAKLLPSEIWGSFFLILMLTVAGDDAFSRGIALIVVLYLYSEQDLLPVMSIAKFTLGRGKPLDVLLKFISQVLGALLAIYFTTWFADTPTIADGGSTRDTIIGSVCLSFIFTLGWLPAESPLILGVTYFVAVSLYTAPLNPALVLANFIVGAIGGDTSFDQGLFIALLAPLAGGGVGAFAHRYLSR